MDFEEAVKIRGEEKTNYVRSMFDSIASNYDLVNLLISLGQTSLWRNNALKKLQLKGDERLLDVGCASGIVCKILKQKHPFLKIEGMDLSPEMILEAQKKYPQIEFFEGDVMAIPRKDKDFDVLTTVYTLRNFPNLEESLNEMVRTLKPGGKLLILDAFPPKSKLFSFFHRLWMQKIVPFLVRPFADPEPYRYLGESIFKHVSVDIVVEHLTSNNMEITELKNYSFKSAAAIIALKK